MREKNQVRKKENYCQIGFLRFNLGKHCCTKGGKCSLKITSWDMKIEPLVSRHL